MIFHIETRQQPDRSWIAEVGAVPGLRVYGFTENEVLASLRKWARFFMHDKRERREIILAFYPARMSLGSQH